MTNSQPLSDSLSDWLQGRHEAVLVTLRQDGSAQSSNISFYFDGTTARISVTADRAKTRNVQRDPRVILHVLGDSFWQYVSIQGSASVSPVSKTPGDAVGQELLEVYRGIAGPHLDVQEYYRAMVNDRRLVLTVTPIKATGYVPD